MASLIRAIQGIWAVLLVIASIFTSAGRNAGQWLARNVKPAALDVTVQVFGDLVTDLNSIIQGIVPLMIQFGGPILRTFTVPAQALAETAITLQQDQLATIGESTPDNAEGAAAKALATAFGFGLASAGTAAAFEAALPERLNTLDGLAPILGKLAGFDEIAGAVLEPLYKNAFGRSLEYHYRSIFKPELPDEDDAVRWHSQRLLTDDDLRKVFAVSGLKSEYETPYVAGAYRGIQPRALATLFEDTPFPRTDIQHMLEFAGVRPVDVPILLDAFELQTTKNVRHQYLSSILIAAERGTIDDATLDDHLNGLNFSDTAKNYVHLTVSLRRLEQLAELYRKQVTALYETGQIDDSQYVPALQSIGIADADAEAHYAVDSARLKGRQLAAAQRDAARQAERLLREQIAGIRQEYLNS